jgi:hypothetical protein
METYTAVGGTPKATVPFVPHHISMSEFGYICEESRSEPSFTRRASNLRGADARRKSNLRVTRATVIHRGHRFFGVSRDCHTTTIQTSNFSQISDFSSDPITFRHCPRVREQCLCPMSTCPASTSNERTDSPSPAGANTSRPPTADTHTIIPPPISSTLDVADGSTSEKSPILIPRSSPRQMRSMTWIHTCRNLGEMGVSPLHVRLVR